MKTKHKVILFGAGGFFVISAIVLSSNTEYLSVEGGKQNIINHSIKTGTEAKSAEQSNNGEIKLNP